MAKIISVESSQDVFTVTYESGCTRTFTKAPKTVLAWLEDHPTMDQSTQSEPGEVLDVSVAETPICVDPVESIQAPEPPSAVWIEASTGAEADEAPCGAEKPRCSDVDLHAIREIILKAWDSLAATVEASWEVFLSPILLALVAFLPVLWDGFVRVALGAARRAVAVAPAIVWGIYQLLGFVAVLAILGARYGFLGVAGLARMLKEGWTLRTELVNDWKAEAA